jgi:organic radical activating enzyme
MSLRESVLSALENIYISPLETCNLNCRYCYTKKTKTTLSSRQILSFVKRYQTYLKNHKKLSLVKGRNGIAERDLDLKSITFCGGEVFLLPDFTSLINTLLDQKIFISIITNGTADLLSEIKEPQNCQLLVSFDGPKGIHDQNRGDGNFDKSEAFVKKALSLGFPVGIFFLITKDSYPYKDSFNMFSLPKTYLTDRLHSLTPSQVLDIKTNYPTYPHKNFGCFQLALQSDNHIYGCCESPTPLAKITDPIPEVIKNFTDSLSDCQKCKLFDKVNNFSAHSECDISRSPKGRGNLNKIASSPKKASRNDISCHGCCSPNFLCGYKTELAQSNCQKVVKLFNP